MTMERQLKITPFLIGAGLGATVMCLLDPSMGRRRRALLQDKSRHYANVARTGAGKATRDAGNRLAGARHRAASLLSRGEEVPDDVVADRVRSTLGRFVRQPRAIDVAVHDGVARLSGSVGPGEDTRIVRRIGRVRGVRGVENALEPRAQSSVPGSEEAGRRRLGWAERGLTTDWWRGDGTERSWNPSTRAATALAGAAAISWAATHRTPMAMAAGATGAALLARGLTNRPIGTMIGIKDRGDVVRVRKTLSIDAPVEQVFRLWSRPELFPRFLTHLERVETTGERRYHWVASGPGGVEVNWDSEVTDLEPNRRLSWRSLEGSAVDTNGTVEFTPEANGGTRVQVDMSYTPPAGLVGHSVAWLTGRDPRTAMNQDLIRMKSLLEDGRTTGRGGEVTLDQIFAGG
jgi:uncharacterized membrane protein